MRGGVGHRGAAVMASLTLLLSLGGCTGTQDEAADGPEESAAVPTPPKDPQRTLGPEAQPPEEIDPCLLSEEEVGEIADAALPRVGPSGGEVFALCTYGDPDGATADLALVDLERVREESGEDVDGEAYIAELAGGVGTGTAEPLDDLGDGSGVLLSYALGSQAWAYVDDAVYGAYASGLGDDDAIAVALLEAVLAEQR